MVRCRQCEKVKYFKTISLLRKHQWAVHREMFDVGRKSHKKELAPIVKLTNTKNGTLSALDVLNKLKEQQDFLTKTISLISHMISNQE